MTHGHFDQFYALDKVLHRLPAGIPLVLHPEAFLKRRLNITGLGVQVPLPSLEGGVLEEAGVDIRRVQEDSMLASGQILILGEIERVKDPFPNDRGVAVRVKNKGLVVIGGCSHAGIINTVKHAQKSCGEGKEMPDQFQLNCVGTTYVFDSAT